MILTFAELKRRLPPGATFRAEFLSGNAKRAGVENQGTRRQVLSIKPDNMVVRYLSGGRKGQESDVYLKGQTIHLQADDIVIARLREDGQSEEWYRISHIVPPCDRPSLEWHKQFHEKNKQHPNALDYDAAGFNDSGQCTCAAMGECGLRDQLLSHTDRNCYADQLRNFILLQNLTPAVEAPVRRLKLISGATSDHGAVARDMVTAERIELCYFCGFPRDEHKPKCPETSTTVIEGGD